MSVDLEKLEQLRAKAIQEKQAPGYDMTAQAAYIAALVFAAPDLMAENHALREQVQTLERHKGVLMDELDRYGYDPAELVIQSDREAGIER